MTSTTPLMAGKKGLIMGLANDKSIAWGIAQALDAQGAQIAFSYQNEALEKRVKPLSETLSFEPTLIKCDVTDSASVEACFKELGEKWGKIDFVVHAIAFSDKNELKGRTIDTTLSNFLNTMHISCYSFLETCRCAAPILNEGAGIVTLTYLGGERTLPNYNIMGVAKAALDAAVRYAAVDLGVQIGRLAREAGTAVEGRSRSGDRRHLVEQPRGQRFERRTTLEHLLDIRTSDHRIEEPFGKRFERRAVREHRQSGRYVSHVFQQAGRKAFERCTAIEHVSDRNGIRTTRREIIRRNRRHGRTTSPKRSHIRDVRKFGQRREIGHFHTVFEEIGGIHGLG